jgi:hypothetical protein
MFLEFICTRGSRRLVESPTRLDHTLHFVFCNNYNCIFNIKVCEPFCTSDRCRVCFQVLHKAVPDSHIHTSALDFKCTDWSGIEAFINHVDFFDLFHNNQSTSVVMDEFYRITNACIELYVPLKSNVMLGKLRSVKIHFSKRLFHKKATA